MKDERKYKKLNLSNLFEVMKKHLDEIQDAPESYEDSVELDYIHPRLVTRDAALFLIQAAISRMEDILEVATFPGQDYPIMFTKECLMTALQRADDQYELENNAIL